MKQIFLSIVLSFLPCFIIGADVTVSGRNNVQYLHELSPTDPRLQPSKYCDSNKCTPTIRPIPGSAINVKKEAESLYKGMQNFGTNEHAVIRVVTLRGIVQRIEFAKAYRQVIVSDSNEGTYKRIEFHLNKEIGGAFKDSILAVLTPTPILYARELHEAINERGTDHVTMVELLCTVNNYAIKAIAEFYKTEFGTALADDIAKDTAGSFQKVLVSLVQGKRPEGGTVNNEMAAGDAKALNGPGAKPWKAKPPFNDIFSTRSYPQLRQVFTEYKKVSRREIEYDIKKEFPGPEGEGLLLMVKCIRSKVKFLAGRLEDTLRMKGGGAMDRSLIRILVSRSEIDLEDIKKEYEKIYKKKLEEVVAKKIGGDYRRVLTNMIRGNAGQSGESAAPAPAKPAPRTSGK